MTPAPSVSSAKFCVNCGKSLASGAKPAWPENRPTSAGSNTQAFYCKVGRSGPDSVLTTAEDSLLEGSADTWNRGRYFQQYKRLSRS